MNVLRRLRSEGIAIIYITHRLEEVFQIADRATVLRDGTWVATENVSDLTIDRLVTYMVGRELGNIYTKRDVQFGNTVLEVEGFSGGGFRNVTFALRRGEILGMFGLVGSGRTEVARAIFGADRASGTVKMDGHPLGIRHPEDAIHAGIALAPEDRKTQGLVLDMPVRENVTLQTLRKIAHWVFLRFGVERQLAEDYRKQLDIRTPSVETAARSLSGGNQQKVVLARCLNAQPKVLILDEPTRGIDIAGKSEVHKLVCALAAQGVGILFISSELPEILGMCDRILVLHEGRLAGIVEQKDATEAVLVALASGHTAQGAVA
jgi:ABC-type sugar transport system ATPase subunit